jgi:hypothetical protein
VSKPFTDIDGQALETFIARVTQAKENNLALSPEDCQLLLDALLTLAGMQERLANHDVTVHKLRKLLGIEKSSEGLGQVLKKPGAKKSTRSKPKGKEEEAFTPVKPEVIIHPLEDKTKGDVCDECLVGKVICARWKVYLRLR